MRVGFCGWGVGAMTAPVMDLLAGVLEWITDVSLRLSKIE